MKRPRHWVSAVIAAIVLCFAAATAFVHWEMRGVDRAADNITSSTAPSIERLADARAELRHLQHTLENRQTEDPRAVVQAQRALDAQVDGYLSLPIAANERELWLHVLESRARLDAALTDDADVAGAISELHDALTASIRGNASHTMELATEIREFRERGTMLALVLDGFCVVIAIGGTLLLRNHLRAHTALLERHRELHEQRASELEAFAGRVAHDILGPLGAASFALEIAEKTSDEDKRKMAVGRGLSAIERIKRIVAGLLDFARAGGRPSEDARADLATSIVDLVTALEPEARRARAEIVASPLPRAEVACNPGVLTSLLSNLARNALKYLGDSSERRVEIRASEKEDAVRVEVADTGPGIPPEIERTLFEPHVRARGAREPGFGLGLATVKRLVEGHGGSVGVESIPGRGATFWFELPKSSPVL